MAFKPYQRPTGENLGSILQAALDERAAKRSAMRTMTGPTIMHFDEAEGVWKDTVYNNVWATPIHDLDGVETGWWTVHERYNAFGTQQFENERQAVAFMATYLCERGLQRTNKG